MDHSWVKLLLPLLLAAGSVPADHPQMYLLSIVHLPLKRDESVKQFSFATWGIGVNAVCHIPEGWRITAGRDADPEGEIAGRGSNGVSWFKESNPKELGDLVLVTLYMPVQKTDVKQHDGIVPATFNGEALVSGLDADRKIPLSYKNIHLVSAAHCPIDEVKGAAHR